MKFTLGCDPEIFLLDANNNFFSAIDTFGGSKEMPMHLQNLGEGFMVQEDNVALEFNIPPSLDSAEFNKNIKTIINYLADTAVETYALHFSTTSACLFPIEQLQDIRALEFGCEPDYNAWTGRRNPRPKAADPRLRSAGGHVHVGLHNSALTVQDKCRLGRLMDLHLGVPSVLMDEGVMRKELYGKAGAMRYKNYGMEYRTLSNFWVFSDVLNQWVWDATERAVDDFSVGRDIQELQLQVVNAINTNDKVVAAELIAEHGLLCIQ